MATETRLIRSGNKSVCFDWKGNDLKLQNEKFVQNRYIRVLQIERFSENKFRRKIYKGDLKNLGKNEEYSIFIFQNCLLLRLYNSSGGAPVCWSLSNNRIDPISIAISKVKDFLVGKSETLFL